MVLTCDVTYDIKYILQCLFLVYLMAPTSWNGSIFLYNKFIRPFILRHEKKVDETLDKAKEAAKDIIDEGKHIKFFLFLQ